MARISAVTIIGLTVLSILLVAGSVTSAQRPRPARGPAPQGAERQADRVALLFRLLDTDGDGALTGDEIEKAGTKLRELDTSKDGRLTLDEFPTPRRSESERPRRGRGGYGFDFGGTSQHDKPPIAKDDREKRVLAVLDEMKKGRWYLNVTTREGRLLRQLTEAVGAKKVVEIGTSSGYSTIWLALGLRTSGGSVITHEIDPEMVSLARENFKKAGVDDLITVVEGDAHETIKKLKGPIDVVFLDAEKRGYVDYLQRLLPLVRPGGLILGHDMNRPRPDPRYIQAITGDPNLESSFVFMQNYGISLTLKKR